MYKRQSLGTLTALTVDDVAINGKVMTMTGSTDDTAVFTVGTNGTLTIETTDTAAAAGNIQITADGTAELAGTTVTLDSGADIVLDAAGNNVTFKSAGTSILDFSNSSSDAVVTASVQDKDIIFKGDDGGSAVTALTMDMSAAGKSIFGAGAVGATQTANATGSNVAGTGSDSSTVPVNKVRSILRRKFDTKTFFKKKKDINESHDTFAGHAVFHVDNDTFANCREGKKKFARWEKYIDLKSTVGQQIRDYAYKYPKKSIIIRNEDGAMIYLKGTHMREKKDWEKGFHMTAQDYEEVFAEMFPPTEVKRTDSISANHHYLKKKNKKKKKK